MYLPRDGCNPIIKNNIFYGHDRFVFNANPDPSKITYNNIVNTNFSNNTYKYDNLANKNGNFSTSPNFLDATNNNYELDESSPCINAGDPNRIYNDVDGTRSDVGAFYFENSKTTITDSNFENYLETHDLNGNTVSIGSSTSLGDGVANNHLVFTQRIANVISLDLSNGGQGLGITNLDGIESFSSIENLDVSQNNLVDLNVIFNSELKRLNGVGNNIIGIDLSSNNKLNYLNLEANPLTSIDLSNNLILDSIILKSTELKKLDLGVNQELVYLDCSSSDLHLLNVLNGNNQNISFFDATNNQNLFCINVDNPTWSQSNWQNIDNHSSYSRNCIIPDLNFTTNSYSICSGSSVSFSGRVIPM